MSNNIAFFDTKPYDRQSFDSVNRGYGASITYFDAHLDINTVNLTPGFNAVCAFVNDTIDAAVIDQLVENGVRLIALRCAGFNNVDFKAAFRRIHVVRVPAYSPHAVAEHALALIMSLNRKTHKAYSRTRDGNFSINGLLGFDMHGKTAGIIGTGKIGRCMIEILLGFGMKVLAFDKHRDTSLAFASSANFQYAELKDIYAKSDIISLHCPLTPETEHMINARTIEQMKPGVMIINTGRGKLIQTAALIHGLKTKKIGAAGLDVYEEESDYFFEDKSTEILTDDMLARLLTFPNVLITSHQAFFTAEALRGIAETTLQNVKEFFDGGYLQNEICYQCGGTCLKKEKKRCF
ncbi:MAG TPA: 2-hydroxyacid dehydrogenase [Kiritimatiellia bacterium]|nr:2-hydroxyacid dehydrogenase [Kiritimatiellia bacterium]